MRLHLPKGLLAALLAACFALPSEAVTTVTVGDYKGTFDSVTQGDAIPSAETPAIWVTTGRMYVGSNDGANLASEVASLNQAGVIILGNGTCSTGESTASTTATQLFLQAWKATEEVDLKSNLIVGANSGDRNAAIRFGADGSYNIKVSGDITVGDDAKFIAGVNTTGNGTYVLITGNIQGANKTLTLSNMNSDGAYKLTGDVGKTINLGGLIVSADSATSHTSVAVKYASATVGNLTVASNASFANAGSLTITGSYVGSTITNTGTLTLADGAVIEVGRLTNTITETATTNEEGTAISGLVTVSGDFTLASGGVVNKDGDVGFTYNGFSYSGSLSEGNLAGTINDGKYFRVVAGDEVAYSEATTDTSISHIEVIGTLTGVKDASITTSIPISGSGSVAVDGILDTRVAVLDQFTGTIRLTGASADNLAVIKFGNNNTHLTRVSKIQLNANSYISGSSNLNFNYNLEFNGGFLLANQGSWVGAKHLLSDSSIQVHRSTNITGAFTAEAGKVLSIQPTTFSDGEANSVLTFSGTVGKLDGATLKIEDGATVAVTGNSGGNAQIAGEIVVNAGGTLKLTGADTLGYSTGNGNYTDSITMTGTEGKVSNLTLTASQTLSTNLVLNGYTSVSGSSVNSFGGSITVSGTNNVFSTELKVRENVTINVKTSGDSLEFDGVLSNYNEGSGGIIKTGEGKLIISGNANTGTRSMTVNAGTLELRSTYNAQLLDLRGADGSFGSAVITAGGSAKLSTSGSHGLRMYQGSSLSLRAAEGEKAGGALSIGDYITIQAAGNNASIKTTETSGEAKYTFTGSNYEFIDADVKIHADCSGTYGAKLTNVALINDSTGNATVTVGNASNTLRGVEAKGGNIRFAANADVAGDIKIASGKSVIVNSGAALTHDGFTYDGSTIKTSNAGAALSLWNNAVITGGTLTQKENADVGHKIIGSTLTDVKLVNTSDRELHLESAASLSAVDIGGKLQVGANTTVSGASTVSGTLEVLADKSLQMSGGANITGTADVKGSLSFGATSSIATLTGSGSLKVSGDTGVTNASGFSGSLESGATLQINSGVKGLKALKINSGGQVWAYTGTDEGSNAITSVKIEEVVLNGGLAGIYVNASSSNATVQTDSLIVSAASTLYSDLTLSDNAGLVVNVGGVTADTATAICSLNGALTLGSELSLTLSNLGKFKAGDSIKLFSDVTSVTYTILTTGGETEIAALSEDVSTTGTLDATGIDASRVFSNVNAGTYTLKFDNNIVSLVAQRDVPEPTTATLSLLALMGLAARRRRRKA